MTSERCASASPIVLDDMNEKDKLLHATSSSNPVSNQSLSDEKEMRIRMPQCQGDPCESCMLQAEERRSGYAYQAIKTVHSIRTSKVCVVKALKFLVIPSDKPNIGTEEPSPFMPLNLSLPNAIAVEDIRVHNN